MLRASGGRCQQCGSTGKLEVDHIVPVVQGGGTEAANGQVLCWLCHRLVALSTSRCLRRVSDLQGAPPRNRCGEAPEPAQDQVVDTTKLKVADSVPSPFCVTFSSRLGS